jgi:protein-L-isoaspartate(D-aspartate) O-methyltransferase
MRRCAQYGLAAILASSTCLVLPAADASDSWAREREKMVGEDLRARDITDREVLRAMGTVPRHEFVPDRYRALSYADRPLPIGYEQTISQPYIVALMSQLARIKPGDRVLEIGTGSGYQAAVLAELGAEVYTIEIVNDLAARATKDLRRLGFDAVHVRAGDGYAGWPEVAPFAAIVVTAAPEKIPDPLLEQLEVGGRLVIPVGKTDGIQSLKVVTRTKSGYRTESITDVRFVPMTGKSQTLE